MSESDRATFMYAAITDVQLTIRSVDTKVAFLLAGMAIPFAGICGISAAIQQLVLKTSGVWHVTMITLSLLLAATWATAFFFALRVLRAVHDPSEAIVGESNPNGCFYSPSLFKFTLSDIIWDRIVTTRRTLPEYLAALPREMNDIEKHLGLEHMKLGFICSRKIAMFNISLWILLVGVVSGSILWLFHLFI